MIFQIQILHPPPIAKILVKILFSQLSDVANVVILKIYIMKSSVADPDPNPDPHIFEPPGSGSISQRYGSGFGSGSFYHHEKIARKTLIPTIL
jgi:hypothetical protein